MLYRDACECLKGSKSRIVAASYLQSQNFPTLTSNLNSFDCVSPRRLMMTSSGSRYQLSERQPTA